MKKTQVICTIVLSTLLFFTSCKNEKQTITEQSKLITLFKASRSGYPNISVHRGGKGLMGFPENCLEAIKYVNDSISAIFEIDVAQTKDGKLVLMHDNSIDRTTNGSGSVKNMTYNELRDYNLIDDFGNETTFKIPLFSKVLEWGKANNVVLTVDIKRSVSQESVIKAIREAGAEDVSIIITYDVAQAQSAYTLAPELLLSVTARNQEELDRLLQSGIPTKNMLAFTGTRLSDASLYQSLHEKDIVCILGALGNLDRQAQSRGDHMYMRWYELGADILATDRPFVAYKAIN
ncbi:MAG: glycerophosphodiester phosphodiesterase family protein [Bacteroidota bacterium]